MRLCGGGRVFARLTRRADFLGAAAGRRFHTERMTVQGLRRPAPFEGTHGFEAGPRFGLTLTKRVGHATERNRIRRRLRGAILEAASAIGDEPFDIVIIGRRPAMEAEFPALVEDLGRAFKAVLKPPSSHARQSRSERSTRPIAAAATTEIAARGTEPEPHV